MFLSKTHKVIKKEIFLNIPQGQEFHIDHCHKHIIKYENFSCQNIDNWKSCAIDTIVSNSTVSLYVTLNNDVIINFVLSTVDNFRILYRYLEQDTHFIPSHKEIGCDLQTFLKNNDFIRNTKQDISLEQESTHINNMIPKECHVTIQNQYIKQ